MPNDVYAAFLHRVREWRAARAVKALLDWDQETYMPPRGAEDRATQIALLAGVAHDRLTCEEIARDIERLSQAELDGEAAANVREVRREHERAVRLPRQLVQDLARATTLAKGAWAAARRDSDFAAFAPHLERILSLKREAADHLGWKTEPYDALMDEFEPGAKAAEIDALFASLQRELTPLAQAIAASARKADLSILERPVAPQAQRALCERVAKLFGFDFEAGRLDVSVHPFCTSFSPRDVRITTRYTERFNTTSLFGVMHEIGHALYEQGFDPAHAFTPMAAPVSLGIHESQSRMWENLVGRGRAFWEYFHPQLTSAWPEFADVSLDDMHRAVNHVAPSLIRVDADEVTYNLHIIVRFDLERRLVRGELAVADVPAAWNDAMQRVLGVTPPDDARGCLQDIHWSIGAMGYFPTYALGNLYAAQFFQAARRDLPRLDDDIRRGEFRPLREWLRENIHRHGRRHRADELVQRITGEPLRIEPFMRTLREKFESLYGLK